MQKILYKENADSYDSLRAMRKMIYFGATDPYIQYLAAQLRHLPELETLQILFDLIYDSAYFQPDPKYIQRIRSAKRTLKDKRANCVDYAVFLGTFLHILNIPSKLRMVSLTEDKKFVHVYIVTNSGIVLDPVPGQDQEGNEYHNRQQLQGQFNFEVPYTHKFDLKI